MIFHPGSLKSGRPTTVPRTKTVRHKSAGAGEFHRSAAAWCNWDLASATVARVWYLRARRSHTTYRAPQIKQAVRTQAHGGSLLHIEHHKDDPCNQPSAWEHQMQQRGFAISCSGTDYTIAGFPRRESEIDPHLALACLIPVRRFNRRVANSNW